LKTTAVTMATEVWVALFTMTGHGYSSLRSSSMPPWKEKLPSWVLDYSWDSIAGALIPSVVQIESADPMGKVIFTSNDRRWLFKNVLLLK
jgi:hypothetical protein